MRKRIGYILFVLLTFILCCAFAVGCDSGGSGNNNGGNNNGGTGNNQNPPDRAYYILTIVDGDTQRQEFIYFEENNHLVPPTRVGYAFEGYFTGDDNMIFNENGVQTDFLIDHDMTLYPKWDPNRVELLFDAADGTMLGDPDGSYRFGELLPTLPVAYKEGWEFTGWFTSDGEQVTDGDGNPLTGFDTVNEKLAGDSSSVQLTAHYSEIFFTVRLHWQSDDYPESVDFRKYRMNEELDVSDLPTVKDSTAKEGTRFKGWTLRGRSDLYEGGPVTSDLDLYGKWVEYRTLTFHPIPERPSEDFTMIVERGETYPAPGYDGKPGYNLDGWYPTIDVNTNPIPRFTYYTDSEEFYAKWSLITYTVEFLGDTYFPSGTYTVETSFPLPTLEEKDGFPFVGWCESPDYVGEILSGEVPVGHTGDLRLYPVWHDFTTVTVYVDGMRQGEDIRIRYGSRFTIAPPELVNKIFNYWYLTDEDQEVRITDNYGQSVSAWDRRDEHVDVYAKYTNTYLLKLSYLDYGTDRTVTVELGRHAENERVSVSLPSALANMQFYGYMEEGRFLTDQKSFQYTMPAHDVELVIDYYYYPMDRTLSANFGYTVYRYGNHYYSYVNVPKTWAEAEEFCEFYGGHLITIATADENKFAADILRRDAGAIDCWLGGQFADGAWKWVTEEEFSYENWAEGEPSGNGNEPYISFYSGYPDFTWNDWGGNNKASFFCEWDSADALSLPTEIGNLKDRNGSDISITAYSYRGHYYAFIQTPMLWTDAELYSEYLGGTLVAVNNAEENDYILRLMRHCGLQSIFIGGTDYETEGAFVWATGEPFTYSNWRRGEPNNGSNNQDYAALYLDGWDDAYNNNSFVFMIEWDSRAAIGNPAFKYLRRRVTTPSEFNACFNLPAVEIELGNDLTLSGSSVPAVNFAGVLDGKGKTIHITGSRGLFATLTGTVHDLKLDVSITDNSATTAKVTRGALADVLSNGTVYNVTVTGSISVKPTSNDTDLGGIIGQLAGAASIYGCINRADVEGVSKSNDVGCVGGIVGYINGSPARFEDNQNFGNIRGVNNVGGIVGWIGSNTTLKNCTNRGSVTASGIRAGGLIGNTNNRASLDGGISGGSVSASSNFGKYVGAGSCTFINPPISEVSTPTDLLGMVFNSSEEIFRLTRDIDMRGQTWTPFDFPATLDGANFTIRNLTVTVTEKGYAGMFSTLTGSVRNVKFENLTVTMSYTDYQNSYPVGGIAGKFEGKEISGVNILSGTIEGKTTYNYIGGLVGLFTAGSMHDCENHATVKAEQATDKGVGGLIGQYTGGTIEKLYNYGSVEAALATNVGGVVGLFSRGGSYTISGYENGGTVNGNNNVGGVFGYYYNVTSDYWNGYSATLAKFTNSGTVSGGTYVGGIIGNSCANNTDRYSVTFTVVDFKNSGNVTASVGYVGGLFGYATSDDGASKITGTSGGTITGGYYVGGLAGYLGAIALVNCSNEGSTLVANHYLTESGVNNVYFGGYAGRGYAFTNCHNAIEINYTDRGQYVGGITGFANGTFTNCSNSATVSAPNSDYVGGLAGYHNGAGTFLHSGLKNTGKIAGKNNVGGLFGRLWNSVSDYWSSFSVTLGNLTNEGSVNGISYVGGLFGYFYGSNEDRYSMTLSASDLSNTGSVTATEGYAGGFFGYAFTDDASASFMTGKSSGSISGAYYVGGLAGQAISIAMVNCSNLGAQVTATAYLTQNGVNYAYLGGYAGSGYRFDQCTNNVTLSYSGRGQYVGGLAGYASGNITACSNRASVTAENADYVGGLIGYHNGSGNLTHSGLSNASSVTGKDYVGGLFGKMNNVVSDYWNSYNVTLGNLSNSSTVSGTKNVGGLFGEIYTNNSDRYTCGIIGNDFTNTGNISGSENVGAFFGYSQIEAASKVTGYTMTGSVTTGDIQDEKLVGGGSGTVTFEK